VRNHRVALVGGLLLLVSGAVGAAPERVVLEAGWTLQSSARVTAKPEALSDPGFKTEGWYAATVPGTVFATLVERGVYPDPYFGMNLRSVKGVAYAIGKNFSNLDMPKDSPFAVSWWYRTEFDVPAGFGGRPLWLCFDGVNYSANIWLNGRRIASASEVAGTFRRYEFEVSSLARVGERNALAVEVFAPHLRDLALTWVDWNPAPPDKDMGLWGGVRLESSGPLALRHPQVVTKLDLPSLDSAHLLVEAEVVNAVDHPVKGVIEGKIDRTIQFSMPVELAPKEHKSVIFDPERVPQLNVSHPRLWWPYGLGTPDLHDLSIEVQIEGQESDKREIKFGIDQITSELTEKGCRLFRVNGKPILIRGGGWAPDMMLRRSPDRLEAELRYVRAMNLNTVRLEGKLERDEFFDLTDRYGILVMAGWCCCDHWEHWKKWSPEDHTISKASLTDQALRLRGHPSLLVWLNGSDNPPPADVERDDLAILKAADWSKPTLSSATEQKTVVSGASGVKMSGPYDYVPPSYWLEDKSHGGAFGFNTETSPGPAIPALESLKEMLPPDHLWPIDEFWNYHAGGGPFGDLHLFTAALEARYGKATGVGDYARKAQTLAYEGERAMFEAFGRNKYAATGVIQWMLNNAWPSMIWHLYDYYLRPGGGYFGSKKACEPLHVEYSYDDRSIVVVNDHPEGFSGLKVSAKVLDLGLLEKFSREAELDVGPDTVVRAFVLPPPTALVPIYFVRLELRDQAGRVVSSNFYWLSAKPDVLMWDKSEWWYTPVKAHEDLTALTHLPMTQLKVSSDLSEANGEGRARLRIVNTGAALAFQVRLKLVEAPGGPEILPIYWDDNYLELLPGEEREITATYRLKDRSGRPPAIEAEGWNVASAAY
jgi:exo-1,4-beta-D-glucosaminidase